MFDFSRIAEWMQVIGYLLGLLVVAPLFPFLYLVLRWRSDDARAGLGTYGALLYFASVAYLLALGGGANLLYGWMSTGVPDPETTRMSWGAFLAGVLLLGLHAGLVRRVPDRASLGEARRVFAGFVTTLCGMVAVGSLVLFLAALVRTVDPAVEGDAADRVRAMQFHGTWTALFLASYVAGVLRLAARARS